MKIRVINENDWEKNYDFDKSIIRIGSQVSCDIQLQDSGIQPLVMQVVRIGSSSEVRHVMRFFAEGIMITRGEQIFPADLMSPYDVLEGDMISFGVYRLFISPEDGKVRVRTTEHMQAELFLPKRELSPESSINGVVELKNLGTEKPCQFRMRISGISEDCLRSSPLPYLYPGASSSVGLIINHLQVKPEPGFHTVSIMISAPDEYYGESLEFNQDIYVNPVFDTEIILEDDSKELTGFNQSNSEKGAGKGSGGKENSSDEQNMHRLNLDEETVEEKKAETSPVRLVGSDDSGKDPFAEDEEAEVSAPYSRRKKKEPVVVIRHNEDDSFSEELTPSNTGSVSENDPDLVSEDSRKAAKITTGRQKKRDPETEGSGDQEETADERKPEVPGNKEEDRQTEYRTVPEAEDILTRPGKKKNDETPRKKTTDPDVVIVKRPSSETESDFLEDPFMEAIIPEPVKEPEPEAEKPRKSKAASKRRPKPAPEPEPVPEKQPEAEPQPEPVPDTQPGTVSEPEPVPETLPETVSEAEPVSETLPETVSEPEAVPETLPETVSEPEPEPETLPEAVSEPEAVPETQPETVSEPEAVPETLPETVSEPEAEPETQPETVSEPEVPAEKQQKSRSASKKQKKAVSESEAEPGAEPDPVTGPEAITETRPEAAAAPVPVRVLEPVWMPEPEPAPEPQPEPESGSPAAEEIPASPAIEPQPLEEPESITTQPGPPKSRKKKTEDEEPEEKPVVVVRKHDDFDDAFSDDQPEEKKFPEPDESPAIRVLKGGGFDE